MRGSSCVKESTAQTDISNDSYLSALYALAYTRLAELIGPANPARTVEIGAGLGLARLSDHRWVCSDVTGSDPIALLSLAQALPYQSGSLDALVLKDTWHHIPEIEQFLAEAHRVLRPGGVIGVFDPYWGVLARFVYRFLHQERWDATTPDWSSPSTDPWDSNQALSYLMLIRDRAKFDTTWQSKFTLIEPQATVGPSFLLSGGVSRRTPIKGSMLAALL
ncbi:MAG: class I SAM-dependent methyltransferase, partial [Actinomycetota bacterium]